MSTVIVRVGTALACVGLIVALGARYTAATGELPVSWAKARSDPASMDGQTMIFTLHQVARGGERPALVRVESEVPLVGDVPELSRGETVSVRGTFSAAEEAVMVEVVERHPLRRAKAALSLPLWLRRGRDGLSTRAWLLGEEARG